MRPTSSARVTNLADVRLELTEAESASLLPRVASAPPLIAALLGNLGSHEWATPEEVEEGSAWLGAAASNLNEPALARSPLLPDRGHFG